MVENAENAGSCDKIWREISNYVDGAVDAALRSSMDEHFKTCKRCSSVLAGMRNVVSLYGDERMLEVPAGFSGRLQKRLAKNVAEPRRGWSSWSAWLVPVAAMALIVGTVAGVNAVGRWNSLRSQHAPAARDVPPDMVVVVSAGAKLFHVPGCPFIHDKNTERTLTAKQAMQEGYVPCPRCLRQYLKTGVRSPAGHVDTADADDDSDEAVRTATR